MFNNQDSGERNPRHPFHDPVIYIVQSVRPEASDWTGLNLGSPKKIVDQTDCSRLPRHFDILTPTYIPVWEF